MNPDIKLLTKKSLESLIKRIRISIKDSLKHKKNVNIPKNILLDYYNIITDTISDQNLTIYLLHIISREIGNSSSLIEKELLLALIPEFYVPFTNTDISLTDPYLSRILTSIQSNILSEVSPLYIGEIFKKIILSIFNEDNEFNRENINKDLFEICQGFCLYNMRQTQYNYQLCGVICLNFLLNEIDYSFLNIKNFILYIWEKIDFFLNFKNFAPKEYLLKYLYDFISKFRIPFKPYVNIAIYKILEFLDDKNSTIRKNSLNILSLLISFYPDEISPIKSLIIQLISILENDKDENIRNKSIYIYNKIKKQFTTPTTAKQNNDKNNETKKNNIYFYDLGNNNNRINNKRIVVRKPIYATNLNSRKNSIKRNDFELNKINRTNSNKTMENKFLKRNMNKNEINENKRYYKENTINSVNINVNKHSIGNDNDMKLGDLLKIVKKKSDNKCKLTNNFSNLRDEVKKNNGGLLQLRKIKSEKIIKTI